MKLAFSKWKQHSAVLAKVCAHFIIGNTWKTNWRGIFVQGEWHLKWSLKQWSWSKFATKELYLPFNDFSIKRNPAWAFQKLKFIYSRVTPGFLHVKRLKYLENYFSNNVGLNNDKFTRVSGTWICSLQILVSVASIITPLTNILPFHWFRACHTICLSFARRRSCDSASVCRALVRKTSTRRAVPRRPLRVRGL